MNQILGIPFPVRLALLFAAGACLGSLANLGIYRLAWHRRPISPWGPADPKAPPRRALDRLPMVGWLTLRRESGIHGRGFWIRPMLLEFSSGIGLAALYWWEVGLAGLLPPELPRPVPADVLTLLHLQYGAHVVLIFFMLVASMIDVDEKTIPDAITVPGTLVGLLLAAACPRCLLPGLFVAPGLRIPDNFWQQVRLDHWPFLQLASPNAWPRGLDGFPHGWPLAIGLGCWWLWCVGLMPTSWYPRHGWRRAWALSVARMVRQRATYRILAMGLIGSLAIGGVWWAGGVHWVGLLSGLVGMAASGGLVWLVRIVCSAVLNREAMGFGDVTLMAMIGAFLGWQTCLIIFFIAPFLALLVGVLQFVLRREREIPYGPFLCLAAVATIVGWTGVWGRTWDAFAVGWLVPLSVVFCIALMPLMLAAYKAMLKTFR